MIGRARVLGCVAGALASAAVAQVPSELGQGATLRALDKVAGDVRDLEMSSGTSIKLGRLDVSLGECRYPVSNPQGEAYAWVLVQDAGDILFSGWMIASSPALSALDHPRYDVWVLRCSTS